MQKTLYVTDLDGTLLDNDKRLSRYTVETINTFIAAGGLFSYASARSHHSASLLVAALNLRLPVITFNGAFLQAPDTGEPLHICMLPRARAHDILAAMLQAGAYPMVNAFIDGRERVSWLAGRETEGLRRYISERTGDPRQRPVDAPDRLFDGEIFYMTVIDTRGTVESLRPVCAAIPGLSVHMMEDTYKSGEFWLEISRHDARKDHAVTRLRALTGADRVVCFGDNLNDIAMFEASDAGYAVENAQPALKAIATGVIGANEADGVARFLAAS